MLGATSHHPPPPTHTHIEGDLSHRSWAPRAQALQEEEVWDYPGFGEVFITSPTPSPLGGQAPLAHKGVPGPALLCDPSSPSANTPGPSLSAPFCTRLGFPLDSTA